MGKKIEAGSGKSEAGDVWSLKDGLLVQPDDWKFLGTESEWIAVDDHTQDDTIQYQVISWSGTAVCRVSRHNYRAVGIPKFKNAEELHSCDQAMADAGLISNAPELLEVLKEIVVKHIMMTREDGSMVMLPAELINNFPMWEKAVKVLNRAYGVEVYNG